MYNESHHLLHDQQVTLTLPLSPGSQAPLFRNYKIPYDPLEGVLTAVEIRKMTKIKINIETYGPEDTQDEPFSAEVRRRLQYALRVLKSSKVLKQVRISLSISWVWEDLLSQTTIQMPYTMDDVKSALEPFLRLGGAQTQMQVENMLGEENPVVDWTQTTRKALFPEYEKLPPEEARHVQDPFGQGLPEVTGFYLDRKALVRSNEAPLWDIRRLFEDPPSLLVSTPRYVKCGECLVVFETAAQLHDHRIFRNHFAEHVLHESPSYTTGYEMFCCGYHRTHYHFKQMEDSALKCGVCLAKFSHWEGLLVHMTAFNHDFFDHEESYKDIGALFNSSNMLTQEVLMDCKDCYDAFGSTQCLRLQERDDVLHLDDPVDDKEVSSDASRSQETPPTKDDSHVSKKPPHQCIQCRGFFGTESELIAHIKEMNASRYAEPGHFIETHHPSMPTGRPGKVPCLFPRCIRSFPSITKFRTHISPSPHHRRNRRLRKNAKPFVQPTLPVESVDGFSCRWCGAWFETRNRLQWHLEHQKVDCREGLGQE